MIRMTKIFLMVATTFGISVLGGCSSDDNILFEHGIAGPNTEATLNQLPEGLLPDSENARHSTDSLQPE